MLTFTPDLARPHFPALAAGPIFFDNPGGTQVAQRVIDRLTDYLVRANANHGGAFPTSAETGRVSHAAHQAMADLLGAASADEIVFGPNMTTLTFAFSRALGRTLKPGDEIVVTHLDHDANIAPWQLLAEDTGAALRWVDFDPADCTLRLADFEAALGPRTRIVACGYASNAVGTINDVAGITRLAHAAGALVYVDAVQYAPHGLIDVAALGCDFLVCSAYKFFGPHQGILYGQREHLERLQAYKVRPAPNEIPGKWETGTGNFEGQAGTLGAVEYFEWLGQRLGARPTGPRRDSLACALNAVAEYERALGRHLIAGLQAVPGLRVWGIADPARAAERVPTVSFTLEGWHPRAVAQRLGAAGINVWDGNYYALAVTQRLGLEEAGGMVRVGLAHYNTQAEVDRLLEQLHALVKTRP
jgi:cysteine desulfurase family protein (TIGR01976 family)